MGDPRQYVVESPYLVPFDGTFRVADAPTAPPKGEGGKKRKKENREALERTVAAISERQRPLHAHDSHAILLVFQAMDAAGKDGTIRAVMSGVDPAGCQVSSFRAPNAEELDHDFLWRVIKHLPERGRIGIFNRSHYEEVLVVRVHPKFLDGQRIPDRPPLEALFEERYDSIRDFERHLARNGTVIVKFWLNVGRDEQRDRFLARIDEPDANWKFNPRDVVERRKWDAYMEAYERALNATSRPWAPWYAVPADDKAFMRRVVADIFLRTLDAIDPRFPAADDESVAAMRALREELVAS
ncbi:MAG: polyphosphate kinase 2 family protein [Sandaracinaceae bacterium]|nr:polyphosphate kinase 2 family protein [Sandaracinaceae bacterium]